jgi:hypothetical protein
LACSSMSMSKSIRARLRLPRPRHPQPDSHETTLTAFFSTSPVSQHRDKSSQEKAASPCRTAPAKDLRKQVRELARLNAGGRV